MQAGLRTLKLGASVAPIPRLPMLLLLAAGVLVLPPPARAATCLTIECHAGIARLPNRHAPVRDDCLACHEPQNKNHPTAEGSDYSLAAAGAELCFQCHDPFQGSVMHAPVVEGDCLACHRPHGAYGPALLETSLAPQNQRPVCFQCHDEEQFSKPYGHGPVALGACTLCHDPHAAENVSLLRQKAQGLCLGCHADFAEGLQKAAFVHSAVQEKDCTACHQPHGSARPALLNEEMRELCFGCHEEIREMTRRGTTPHQPVSAQGSCGNCHLIHYGEHSNLLFKKEQALCLDCHGDAKTDAVATRNIQKEISGKEHLHGPLQEHRCTPCHEPHGSRFAALLKGDYPGSFYASYRAGLYDFCFTCHDPVLMEDGVAATGFRNGTRNLHGLHVAREVKGRTCMACHASHASNSDKLITREGVPFGSWLIPLRFEKRETGGSCMPGCHRKMAYDREKPE